MQPEPYILTPEEEIQVIENEIVSLKKLATWKMIQLGTKSEQSILNKLSEIDWEKEIDKDEILRRANSNKNRLKEQKKELQEEKQRRIKEREALVKKCDAKYFWRLMKWNCEKIGKRFEQDSDNINLIKTVCFFLSRDQRFEYDLNKGLLIRGISGLGKTFLFELVRDNELNPVKIVSMIEISEEIKSEGEYNLELNNEKIIYLDDVGTEEAIINYYGTKISWFKDFIEKEYQYKNSFKNLVISTNLSFQQVEEKYGFRVRSRMKEMFNVIDVKGKDRRR